MHVKTGVAIEPSGDRGMFMSGVIVGDDVDGEIARGLFIDVLRKASHSWWRWRAARRVINLPSR